MGQFDLGHHALVLSVEILFGAVFRCTCGQHNDAVVDLSFIHARSHQNFGGEISFESGKPHDKGTGQDLDLGMGCHPLNQFFQIRSHIRPFDGGGETVGHAPQFVFLFNQNHREPLVCKTQCGIHPGHPATDDQRSLNDRNLLFMEGMEGGGTGHRHFHQMFGFYRGFFRIIGMDPGILISDIGHLKEVFVDPAGFEGVHEYSLVGFGRACRHHDPVESVFLDDIFHFFLGVLGAGEEILSGVHHMGKCFGIFFQHGDVHDTRNVDTAVADKDPDSRCLFGEIDFFGKFDTFCQGVSGLIQAASCQTRSRTRFCDGAGNIFGFLKHAACINPRSGRLHRRKSVGNGKLVLVKVHIQPFGQISGGFRHLKTHRKDDHIEDLFFQFAGFVHILNAQISLFPHLVDGMDPCLDKSNVLFFFGPKIVFFVVLSKGADIHVENGTIEVSVGMLFGDHGVFDGIHAADRRAVTVAASVGIPGADALEPGDLFRRFFIRRPDQMSHGGTGSAENPFKFKTGHDVWIIFVMIELFQTRRIEGLASGAQHHGAHIDIPFHPNLAVIHSLCQTCVHTLIALRTVTAVQTACGFLPTGRWVIAQFHFFKITCPFFHGQFRHF